MALDFLFGDDIFISYARKDGHIYATGLADALTKEGFACFLDKLGTDAGPSPPKELLRKAEHSKMLVLIGTDEATRSQPIQAEIEAFAGANGTSRIAPIAFGPDVDWSKALWYLRVQGMDRAQESLEALRRGNPDDLVVIWIRKRFTYVKSKDRLRRYRNSALIIFLVLLVASGLASWYATSTLARAGIAERRATLAEEQMTRADEQARVAQGQQVIAEAAQFKAASEAKKAESRRRIAEVRERAAHKEARRQHVIALSRELANRANLSLSLGPDSILDAVTLAIEAVEKAGSAGTRILEADTALRRSLALLPILNKTQIYPGPIRDLALSPNGESFATLGHKGRIRAFWTNGTDVSVTVERLIRHDTQHVAVSNKARHIAISSLEAVDIFDKETGRELRIGLGEMGTKGNLIEEVALSPDGRYLAVIVSEFVGEHSPAVGEVVLWDLKRGGKVASLGRSLDAVITDVAFGPKPTLLGAGCVDSENGETGYAVLWELSHLDDYEGEARAREQGTRIGDRTLELERFRVVERMDGVVNVIAPGEDVHQFAIASGGNVSVWKDRTGGRYEPVMYLPLTSSVRQLAFSKVGTVLSVIEEEEWLSLEEATLDPPSWFHSLWTLTPDATALCIPYDSEAFNLLPGPDDRLAVAAEFEVRVLQIFNENSPEPVLVESIGSTDPLLSLLDGRFVLTQEGGHHYLSEVFKQKRYKVPISGSMAGASISENGDILVVEEWLRNEPYACIYNRRNGEYAQGRCIPNSNPFALSADGKLFAFTLNEQLHIVNTLTMVDHAQKNLPTTGGGSSLEFSPTGRYLAILKDDQHLSVIRTKTGNILATIEHTNINDFAFSRNEAWLATAGDDQRTAMLEIESGKVLHIRHLQPVQKVAFSADAKILATVSHTEIFDVEIFRHGGGSTVRLIDPKTGVDTARLQLDRFVTAVTFSLDGKYLFTGSDVSTGDKCELSVLRVQSSDLIGTARQRLESLVSWRNSPKRQLTPSGAEPARF